MDHGAASPDDGGIEVEIGTSPTGVPRPKE